jgi:hypothetical protein
MKSELLSRVAVAALLTGEGLGASVCGHVWQGDFGKGVATGSGVYSEMGANPCLLYQATSAASPSTGYGVPQPQWRPGMIVEGDRASEFVFCQLVLASATDLLPGQVYEWDENYNLTLLTTANGVLNAEFGVLNVWAPQTPAGTYYCWVQRAGHAAVQAAASSIATGQAETTATAGQVKFLNTHTSGTKSTDGLTAFGASSSISFTGNTTSGSPYITNVVSGNSASGVADLTVGMAFTMAGFTNAIVAAIDKQGSGWRITVGTNTAGSYSTLQNATATASAVSATVTSHVVANVYWPQLKTQN